MSQRHLQQYSREVHAIPLLSPDQQFALEKELVESRAYILGALAQFKPAIEILRYWRAEIVKNPKIAEYVFDLDVLAILQNSSNQNAKADEQPEDCKQKNSQANGGQGDEQDEDDDAVDCAPALKIMKQISDAYSNLAIMRAQSPPSSTEQEPAVSTLIDLFSSLPLKNTAHNELKSALRETNKALYGVMWQLMRLAADAGIRREDFPRAYAGHELDPEWPANITAEEDHPHKKAAWQNFAASHANHIRESRIRIQTICQQAGLSLPEYREIYRTFKDGEERYEKAKKTMAESFLRLVFPAAMQNLHRGLSLPDLIQEGNIGLMKAVDKFDYRRGRTFSTHARLWIWQNIGRSIANTSRTIRIPVHLYTDISKVVRASIGLLNKTGHKPTPDAIAEELDVPIDKVRKIFALPGEPVSFQTPVSVENNAFLGDYIEDKNAVPPLDAAIQAKLREAVEEALEGLGNERHTRIMRRHYGIGLPTDYTLEEIGQMEGGVSKQAIFINGVEKALKKLRDPDRSKKLREFWENEGNLANG